MLRLPKVANVASESPLADKDDLTQNLAQLEIVEIIPSHGLGRFSLNPSQYYPRVAYLNIALLQDALDQPERANTLFVIGKDAKTAAA